MPDITADQALVLPNATDNANGPLAFQNYNAGVEDRLVKRYSSDADRTFRNPTPADGEFSYLLDTQQFYRYDNGGWLTVRASDSTLLPMSASINTCGLLTSSPARTSARRRMTGA